MKTSQASPGQRATIPRPPSKWCSIYCLFSELSFTTATLLGQHSFNKKYRKDRPQYKLNTVPVGELRSRESYKEEALGWQAAAAWKDTSPLASSPVTQGATSHCYSCQMKTSNTAFCFSIIKVLVINSELSLFSNPSKIPKIPNISQKQKPRNTETEKRQAQPGAPKGRKQTTLKPATQLHAKLATLPAKHGDALIPKHKRTTFRRISDLHV